MRSDNAKAGVERAPNRSLLYALGYTDEELSRPLVGVVSSYNEVVPGHMNLDKIAEAVKAGIRAAGGTPVEFPAIAVCDGIAMGHVGMKYSLVTRDLIADSTEAMVMAHQFDGLVMTGNKASAAATDQDGYAAGELLNWAFTQKGELQGQYSNGQTQVLDVLRISLFPNEGGLLRQGSTLFVEAPNSDNPVNTTAGVSGAGFVRPGALENSNVDIASEFVPCTA